MFTITGENEGHTSLLLILSQKIMKAIVARRFPLSTTNCKLITPTTCGIMHQVRRQKHLSPEVIVLKDSGCRTRHKSYSCCL